MTLNGTRQRQREDRPMKPRRRRPFLASGARGDRRRGQVLLLIVLGMGFMFSLGGLAVDMIYVYTVKVRLTTAIDSVALGVSRALGRGVTVGDQGINIARTAELLFRANFPSGFMMTKTTSRIADGPKIYGPNVTPGTYFEIDATVPAGMREVRLIGEVKVPTFFMRVFGTPDTTVRHGASATRRDVNVMMVLDRSGSMTGAWPALEEASIFFLDQFDNTTDKLGIVTFGTNARVDFGLNTGFKTGDVAENIIIGQDTPDNALTNSSWGLWQGFAELLEENDPNALNVMVFFTDGNPTGYTGLFSVKTSSSSSRPWCDSSPVEAVIGTGGNFDWDVSDIRRFANPYGKYPSNYSTGRDYVIVNGTGSNQLCQSTENSNWRWDRPYATDVEDVFASGTCLPQNWTPSFKNPSGGSQRTYSTSVATNGSSYGVNPCNSALRTTSGSSSTRGKHVHRTAKTLSVNVASDARTMANSLGGVYVYTIGLGAVNIDADFLERLANDPNSGSQVSDGSQTVGAYFASPSTAQLRQAFQLVANQIFRLIN